MKKLWISFAAIFGVSFLILGWVGTRIYQEAPPVPRKVVTTDGTTVIAPGVIDKGQNVWQTMGGMEVGSVWGHGSYVAPDWTADWLHRESEFILNDWAKADYGRDYASLKEEDQFKLRGRLQSIMRKNTYNPATGVLTIPPVRARAFAATARHYADVFANGRRAYAIPKGTITDPVRLRDLSAFFFWSAWAASTNRPGDDVSYTHNWPHEALVGNNPSGDAVLWTVVSVVMLLAGIGSMVWFYASHPSRREADTIPATDPLRQFRLTPSQRAVLKYFWVVCALFLAQIFTGIITAHYGVEGNGFYGIPLAIWLPYSVTRTWHVQLGLFWIATSWLGAGLFVGPLVSGSDPKYQRLGVNVLFGALLLVVVGSMTGEWLSIKNKLSDTTAFYFGHQGYEYVDLGRVWQIALFIGLLLWMVLMVRGILPALRAKGENKHLLTLLLLSVVAIGLFYGAGLTWGQHTHLSIVEYWRWWVVHLWVEGFFEVFSTTVIAFFFARLHLVKARLAAEAALLSATIYLAGGIIGTLHHLYFAGTPTVALAWGSVFSALEVVPLVLIAFAAMEDHQKLRAAPWMSQYKWPIYFFVAVAFWNMVGAGLFGFMINPPIALYYMQGLNTTPLHGHAALFGVYGMLGMGLILFCLRIMTPGVVWREGLLKFSFWTVNLGLAGMCLLSLLPVGLMQTWASVKYGYWFARSAQFLETPLMRDLRWMRVPGDTVFTLGAVAFVIFVAKISAIHLTRKPSEQPASATLKAPAMANYQGPEPQ